VLSTVEAITSKLRSSPIARDTFVTTALGVVGRSANLLVPFVVGILFGATADTDALFLALGILVLFTGVFAWAVEAVMVPFVAKLRAEGGRTVGNFVGGVLLWLALGVFASGVVLLVVAKPMLALVTNLSVESVSLSYSLVLELSPVLLLVMLSSILSGVLNAYRIFWAPASSTTLALSVVIGLTYLGKGGLGVHAVALGYVTGEVCRLLFLWSVLRRTGIAPIRFRLEERETLRAFLKLSSYMILGMVVAGLAPLINRIIASHWGPGSVSIVEYAEMMFYIPAGLLGSGFLIVVLAHWSQGFHDGGVERLRADVYSTMRLLGGGALIASVLLYALRHPLISLALDWGKIPPERLAEVSELFGVYLLGLLPNVVSLVFVRAHLVLKNTDVLMKAAFVAVAVLLLLNAVLTPHFALTGIALANAGSQLAVSLYLLWALERSLGTSGVAIDNSRFQR